AKADDKKVADDKKADDKKADDKKVADDKKADDKKVVDDKKPAPAKVAKLTLDISPADAAPGAKITLDGKDVKPGAIDISLEGLAAGKKKTVDLVIDAAGYHQFEKKIDVTGDLSFKAELVKRVAAPQQPAQPQQ